MVSKRCHSVVSLGLEGPPPSTSTAARPQGGVLREQPGRHESGGAKFPRSVEDEVTLNFASWNLISG
jgi:hypothetical protein